MGGLLLMWDERVVENLNACFGGLTVACSFWSIEDKLEWDFAKFMVPTLIVEKLFIWDQFVGLVTWWNCLIAFGEISLCHVFVV